MSLLGDLFHITFKYLLEIISRIPNSINPCFLFVPKPAFALWALGPSPSKPKRLLLTLATAGPRNERICAAWKCHVATPRQNAEKIRKVYDQDANLNTIILHNFQVSHLSIHVFGLEESTEPGSGLTLGRFGSENQKKAYSLCIIESHSLTHSLTHSFSG